MVTYAEKLRDPRWQKKRLEILERDGWRCVNCTSSKATLHVHHAYYLPKASPWEYPPASLVTLCEECHKAVSEGLVELQKAVMARGPETLVALRNIMLVSRRVLSNREITGDDSILIEALQFLLGSRASITIDILSGPEENTDDVEI